jgi:hypothetical protein
MAKKLIVPMTNRLTDSLGNHARHEPKPAVHGESTKQLLVMSFLTWVDPPIGVNMNGIDNTNPNYKVSIMTVYSSSTGLVLLLPFTESIAWNPVSAPTLLQYQLTSALSGDPTGSLYYETMTVTQASPGMVSIRSRVFLTPSSTPFTNAGVTTSTATVASPAIIQVNGVVNSYNQEVTVYYEHFLPSDFYGPTDLYLQQPW